MKQKKLRITKEDFILANRRAARMEEIERHGHPRKLTIATESRELSSRAMTALYFYKT